MIRLVGPAARVLGQQFDYDRQFAAEPSLARPEGGLPLPPFVPSDTVPALLPTPTSTRARVVGTGVGRRTTKQALLQNLRAVRHSVCVAMCEMGQTDVLHALIEARARGVCVRVLLDPLRIEEYLPPLLGALGKRAPAGILNAGAIKTLREAGVDVRLYRTGADFLPDAPENGDLRRSERRGRLYELDAGRL
jgi:phosphatidylserine/phosphatidylglycerophosphate/cardiolipin synthase-like enzyme